MPLQQRAFQRQYEFNDPHRQVVRDGETFQHWVNFLQRSPSRMMVFDYETSGLKWYQHAQAVGIGFGTWDDRGQLWAAYVPFRHTTGEYQLDYNLIAPAIKQLLADETLTKIAHNIKFEDHMSRREGWQVRGPRIDTMIAARLEDENRSMRLEDVAASDLMLGDAAYEGKKLLDAEVVRLAKARRMGKRAYLSQYGYSEVPVELCGFYGATDVQHTGNLAALYLHNRVPDSFPGLWTQEMDMTSVLCDIEQTGMPIDVEYIQQLKGRSLEKRDRALAMVRQAFELPKLNPNSDDQIRKLMVDKLKLPMTLRTKGDALSVEGDVIASFTQYFPSLQHILDFRDADKIVSTYTDSLLSFCDDQCRLHGELNQMGTNTGRLSSKNPNYQNMTSEDKDRAAANDGIDPFSVRRAFVVEPGHTRLYSDYSQVELRVLAKCSMDPVMVDAYLKNEDIHDRTAKEVGALLGHELPRRVAKVINFGLSYCLSDQGLARQAKIPQEEATKFLEGFFQKYEGIRLFRFKFWNQVRTDGGEFRNMFGRRRRIPGILSEDRRIRTRSERQAIGSLIQGTAAEFTRRSLVNLTKAFAYYAIPAKIVNTVHDEIQIDAPNEYLEQTAQVTRAVMEDYPQFAPIPILTDFETSTTHWAAKKSWELAR